MICLVFVDEAKADTANDKIWSNIIEYTVGIGKYVVDAEGNLYNSLAQIAGIPRNDLRLPGYHDGEIVKEGETFEYAIPRIKYEGTEWYFIKPKDIFMADVVDYVEEEFNHDWLPPS